MQSLMNIVKKIVLIYQLLCLTGLAYAADDISDSSLMDKQVIDQQHIFNFECVHIRDILQEQGHHLHLRSFHKDAIDIIFSYLIKEKLRKLSVYTMNHKFIASTTYGDLFAQLKGFMTDQSKGLLYAAYWIPQNQDALQKYGDRFKEENSEYWDIISIQRIHINGHVSCDKTEMNKTLMLHYPPDTLTQKQEDPERKNSFFEQYKNNLLAKREQSTLYQGKTFEIFTSKPGSLVTLPEEGVVIIKLPKSSSSTEPDILAVYQINAPISHSTLWANKANLRPIPVPVVYEIVPLFDTDKSLQDTDKSLQVDNKVYNKNVLSRFISFVQHRILGMTPKRTSKTLEKTTDTPTYCPPIASYLAAIKNQQNIDSQKTHLSKTSQDNGSNPSVLALPAPSTSSAQVIDQLQEIPPAVATSPVAQQVIDHNLSGNQQNPTEKAQRSLLACVAPAAQSKLKSGSAVATNSQRSAQQIVFQDTERFNKSDPKVNKNLRKALLAATAVPAAFVAMHAMSLVNKTGQ